MNQDLLQRRLEREKAARKAAESILEGKALELYQANQKLNRLNQELEAEVRRRSARLAKSELRYRQLVESAKDLIYHIDAEGLITFVNQVVKDYGYKSDQVVGAHFYDFISEEYRDEVHDFYKKMRDTNQEENYLEFPVVRIDGRKVWLGQNVRRIKENGGPDSFIVIARDITESKAAEEAILRAQKALEKSEIKYRSIIENMRLGLMEVDLDGNVTRAYPLFCEMVGYTSRELIGQNATTLLLDQENQKILNKQHHARIQGEAGVYEVEIKRKDGEKIWVLISGAPFFDMDGNVIGSIGIHYDISDRKELEKDLKRAKEEAERAQEAEAQFLASMSHEIRTPLNAVLGMTHLLEDTSLDDEQEEYLRVLRHSADILKGLISDILDISKIDAGKVEIHEKPFNLSALLQSIESLYQVKTDSKPVSVKAFIDPRIQTPLLGDELILNQILHNLMSNAEKFTDKGHIHLRANVLSEDGNEIRIKFDIEDTGIGIEADKLELIFEEFKQANAEIRKSHGGTGLGLAITTKLVELCQGTMDVRSRRGAGSTFSFTLTFKKTVDKLVAEDKSVKILEGFEEQHRPILIAEDNAMNRKYISKLLEKWKLVFEIVENGAQAVEQATKHQYSMIIMDLQMPEMTGMEATQWIREHENPNRETPIVALTASTLLSKKEEALNSGMSDFLTKPFHPGSLHEVISKYITLNQRTVSLIEKTDPLRASTSPIDQDELQKLYGDDVDYKRTSFQMFIDTSHDAMDKLSKMIQQGDYLQIASVAHRIKPNFGLVGLIQCMEQIADIENMAKEEVNLEKIKVRYESISRRLQEAWPHILREAKIKENKI